jgi:hypothetical protein
VLFVCGMGLICTVQRLCGGEGGCEGETVGGGRAGRPSVGVSAGRAVVAAPRRGEEPEQGRECGQGLWGIKAVKRSQFIVLGRVPRSRSQVEVKFFVE